MNKIDQSEADPKTNSNAPPDETGGSFKLPFDPLTILIGLWRRRTLFLMVILVSTVLAVIVALQVGTKTYVAYAIMLYEPPSDGTLGDLGVSLNTLVDMVKSAENIGKLREELDLPASLKEIGSSIDVELKSKTTLIEISVTWDNPEMASKITNTLCDIYLESLAKMKKNQLTTQEESLTIMLGKAGVKLSTADDNLQKYMAEHNLIDMDKETEWYFQQLNTLSTLYDEAVSKVQSLQKQRDDIGRITDNLKKRVAKEQESQSANLASTTENNVKIQRLRELISETRNKKAHEADLIVREQDLKRAEKLFKLEAISKSEYEKTLALYQRAKAMIEESPEIIEWQNQIKQLDKGVVPSSQSGTTSGRLLEDMMMRVFDIELSEVAQKEQVSYLDDSLKEVRKRLDLLPKYRRELVEKNRSVQLLEDEEKKIRDQLGDVQRRLASKDVRFDIITRAVPPLYPKKSNRKLLFTGTFVFGSFLGFLAVVGLVITDLKIHSTGESKAFMPAPLHLTIPDPFEGAAMTVDEFEEKLRIFAAALRRDWPKQGTTLVVTSAKNDPGTEQIAVTLATSMEIAEQRILLFDAHVRENKKELDPIDQPRYRFASEVTLLKKAKPIDRFLKDPSVGFDEVIAQTDFANLDLTHRPSKPMYPEVLKQERIREFFKIARQKYSLIIISAPPTADRAEIDYLAQLADAAIVVTRAETNWIWTERQVMKRLAAAQLPLAATTLIGVRKPYR